MYPVVTILVFLLVIGWVAYAAWSAAQRRQELATWAASRGLDFAPGHDRDLDNRHRHFNCLRRGHSRYASNVMRGELAGLPVIAFDFRYVTGHGKNRSTHDLSAVIAHSEIPLQHLFLRREQAFDKVTEFFGADDIDFESAEFSNKFYVKARDKKWAYTVIHQGMMDYLLQAPAFSVQLDTCEIIAWRSGRMKPGDFQAAAELIRGLLDRLPAYLVQQQMDRATDRKET